MLFQKNSSIIVFYNMEINQIISLLRKPEHRFEGNEYPHESMIWDQNIVLELNPDQDKLYTAILKTIPKETLMAIASRLRRQPNCALSLIEKIEWMSQEHPPKIIVRNEPIGRLLRYYLDKKSKKVAYARTQLRSRFIHQSYQEQNRILKAFLKGSKHDCEWAARSLRDNWRKEMTGYVSDAWENTGVKTLAYVILRHFPNEYILQEQTKLSDIAGYQYVCARVGNEPSFIIDESRLSTPDHFYVLAKLGREVDANAFEQRFYDYLLTYPYDYKRLHHKTVSLLSIDGVDRMIWAMGVLGMQDALIRLLEFRDKVMSKVQNVHVKDSQDSWPIFVSNMKLEIDPFLDPDITEKEELRYKEETDPYIEFEDYDDLPLY